MPVKARLCTGLMGHTQEGRGISQNPTLKEIQTTTGISKRIGREFKPKN